MILTHGSNSVGFGGTPLPEGYTAIDFLSIPYKWGAGGVNIPFSSGYRSDFKNIDNLEFYITFTLKDYVEGCFFCTVYDTNSSLSQVGSASSGGLNIPKFISNSFNYYRLYDISIDACVNNEITIAIKKNLMEFDGNQLSVANSSYNVDYLNIGTANAAKHAGMDITDVTIIYDGNTIAKCVPAKRNLDDTNGLIDLITGDFFALF